MVNRTTLTRPAAIVCAAAVGLAACGGSDAAVVDPAPADTDAAPADAPAADADGAEVAVAPTTSSTDATTAAPTSTSTVAESTADDEPVDAGGSSASGLSYTVVDTGQAHCFGDGPAIECGSAYAGQDAEFVTTPAEYVDNGDGTITDVNTGLMWLQDPGDKVTYDEAVSMLETFSFAGYDDWRLPTIEELYSLTDFTGTDPSGVESSDAPGPEAFIDDLFVMPYGDESGGARVIDSQWLTSTINVDTVMNGETCFFGFNFADGRIKCCPLDGGGSGGYFALFVRGATDYGVNEFVDQGDGTVVDAATGLTWTQQDSGEPLGWDDALSYCLDLELAGIDDWRLPDVKELQTLVDYTRSPDGTDSAAIDPVFDTTGITNEAGQADFPFFWSSTTHLNYQWGGASAAYVTFGRALGNFGKAGWIDVHGAGAQRSDPKEGDIAEYADGFGPQGDAVRIENFARCVSGGATPSDGADPATFEIPGASVAGTSSAGGDAPGEATGPAGGPPDLAAAAAALGVAEAELAAALGPPPPDLAEAAATLGVTEAELVAALGVG